MIEIDGSTGEGGGQIIRSSLALSAVTGKAFRMNNVRANRSRPGLQRQHLTAVNAASQICDATVKGNTLHSTELVFTPGETGSGRFEFQIGSAGSTTLVAQTVIPALILTGTRSTLIIEGGTHNPTAPPFDFLQRCYVPQLEKMGPRLTSRIETYGFYPAGGGRIVLDIEPVPELKSFDLLARGAEPDPQVTALVSRLPESIAERECRVIRKKSGWPESSFRIRDIVDSPGPGNVVMIELKSPDVTEMFTGFGQRGVRAEEVARRVWRQTEDYLKGSAPVGEYLCDQLMLPFGLAADQGSAGRFRATGISSHSRTHIGILQTFLDISITARTEDHFTELAFQPRVTCARS